MKILIVGDGKVGSTLAEQLSKENHDITIIDKNADALRRSVEKLDVLCIKGNGVRGSVLREAGVEDADLMIAATSGDEMNMVCCLTAKKLGAKYTVARIRDPEYVRDMNMLKRELEIDSVINPEMSTAADISRILRFPGASRIELFVRGRVEMVGLLAEKDDIIVDTKLKTLRRKVSGNILFCACERGDGVFIPNGETVFQPGDIVYVIGEPTDVNHFFRSVGRNTARVKDVIIVGGGRIARYLTDLLLKMSIRVKIIEINPNTAVSLSEDFPDAMVINADGTDMEVLENENIRSTDAFIALTNRDEDNLMVALCAKQCGVGCTIAKASRPNFEGVAKALGLGSVVSPKAITADHIIHLVRGMENSKASVMETLYRIVEGKAEAMEFVASKTTLNLAVPFKDVKLIKDGIVAVIVRKGRIIIPGGDDHIEDGDSVVIVTKNPQVAQLNDIFAES